MKIRTLSYSIKQGLKNIYRNRLFSLASIGTIMACLFLFGIFYFIIANFRFMIQTAETSVGVTVFFEAGISKEEITSIGEEIKARLEVAEINFISAEEAWDDYKNKVFKDAEELTDTFKDDNPLEGSDSYEIYLNDVSKQSELVQYIEGIEGVRKVKSSDAAASGLSSFNLLVGYISGTIIIILVAVAVFLISTTVTMGISVRKDEISIMRLIGATDFFVRAPFIVEGVIIGIIGAALPLLLLYFLYQKVIDYVSVKFSILKGVLVFMEAGEIFSILVPVSLLIGVGIGFFGSYMTVRKHLRV